MADTSCSKEKWAKYEFGEYYARVANKYKLTPYEMVFGDSYTQRNVSQVILLEIRENWPNYVYYWSGAMGSTYLALRDEEKGKAAAIFNQIVKKDNACYQKLK